MKKKIHFLGACMGLGAQIQTTSEGPLQLLESLEFSTFVDVCEHEISQSFLKPIRDLPLDLTLTHFNTKLKKQVEQLLRIGSLPIVVGGDHSIAIGTWFANIEFLRHFGKELGLIWIDAHMDAHTFESSPSKAYHGMPLATLLGYGPALIENHNRLNKLLPKNLILIATRSYEEEEAKFLKEHNVKVYYMHEVTKEGFSNILLKAYQDLKSLGLAVGISFDFDALDPVHAPGVGSQEKCGLCKQELLKAFSQLHLLEDLICLELVEYNPNLDENSRTKKLAFDILNQLLLQGSYLNC